MLMVLHSLWIKIGLSSLVHFSHDAVLILAYEGVLQSRVFQNNEKVSDFDAIFRDGEVYPLDDKNAKKVDFWPKSAKCRSFLFCLLSLYNRKMEKMKNANIFKNQYKIVKYLPNLNCTHWNKTFDTHIDLFWVISSIFNGPIFCPKW